VIGRVVGKYKILDQIGEGGMGVVYQAEHVVLGSPAAVKVLLPQYTKDETVVDRFFTEAKASSAIRHVGVVEVFDFGRLANDQAYIAMELLRGEALSELIARIGPFPAALAGEITAQVLGALNATHAVGVIHRDLKPDNIFLTRDRGAPGGIRVKVLDFGIAKLVTPDGNKAKTQSGSILGTPSYMSPEQCKGGIDVDGRADLYALGCIVYQMLAGAPPFVADGGGEIMAMQIYQPPPRLPPHLGGELDALVQKLLAKRPDERAPSAAWALAAVERIGLPHLDGEVPLANTEPVRPSLNTEMLDLQVDAPGLPTWIPVTVILFALALAGAAIYVIGFSGLL
jgi:serine/threonine-protein kinase